MKALIKGVTSFLLKNREGINKQQSSEEMQRRLMDYFIELEHYDFFTCDKNFVMLSDLKSAFHEEPALRLEDFVAGETKPHEKLETFLYSRGGRVEGKYLVDAKASLFFLPVAKDEILKSFTNKQEEKVISKAPDSFLIYIELNHMLKNREAHDLLSSIHISPVTRFFLRKGKRLEDLKSEIAATFNEIIESEQYGRMNHSLTLKDAEKQPALFKDLKFMHIRFKNWSRLTTALQSILNSFVEEKHLTKQGVFRYSTDEYHKDQIKWSFSEDSPFSSFFINDLKKVKVASEKGEVGAALKTFLDLNQWEKLKNSGTQIDFFSHNSLQEMKRILTNIPMCKWPSPYSLSLMQQIALNLIHEKAEKEAGFIFSVNGPPGTGKTTLLKDSFANILFDKVSYLSGNTNLFSRVKYGEGNEDYFYSYPSELRKYRVLVVSNNNAAVENISKDLPLDTQLVKKEKDVMATEKPEKKIERECRYLGYGKVIEGKKAWGTVSAAMGKKDNITSYFEQVLEEWADLPELAESVPKQSKEKFTSLAKEIKKQIKTVKTNSQFTDMEDANWQISKNTTYQYASIDNDDHLNCPRSQLFAATMDEYIRFLYENKNEIDKNLNLARIYFCKRGTLDKHLVENDEFVQAMFDTIFLITPILSSTFSSVPRFLEKLKAEDIGWLFIDEAGMATPQSAIGAIWRSKNVIAVGDPLQIAPVNPLRVDQLQHIARDGHGFTEKNDFFFKLTKPEVSVQEFADAVNRHGGYIKDANQNKKWLGSPLRVHRRCEDPMFTICNQTTYQEKMIFGTEPSANTVNPLYESQWISIGGKSKGKGNHFIKEQGDRAFEIANTFLKDHPKKTCFIITPFVTVKTELERILGEKNQGQIKVGTVHTFQGKEAPLVIFVLGVDDKREGPIKWAASTPNLLNVAASRAQNYFVVIGNAETWGEAEYFKTAHQLLARITN